MTTTTQPTKPKRRWYQFSLLTLLIVTTLLCLAFACIGWRMQRARVNRERVAAVEKAVTTIEELGGKATYAYEDRRPQTWLEIQFDDPGERDDPIGVLKVTVVDLTFSDITDDSLEHVSRLTELQSLTLFITNVTDAGVVHLKRLTELQHLNLRGTFVSTEGIEMLRQALPNCEIDYDEVPDW